MRGAGELRVLVPYLAADYTAFRQGKLGPYDLRALLINMPFPYIYIHTYMYTCMYIYVYLKIVTCRITYGNVLISNQLHRRQYHTDTV